MSDFEFQIAMWGWADDGGRDFAATISETRAGVAQVMPSWDAPKALDRVLLDGNRPPDWMACYWLAEHARRGHAIPQDW